nr:integrase, catalytic region, zinc finger, CCHC-type, peptidase aspartic, catalytic [Tanacetum cinerariifolium]
MFKQGDDPIDAINKMMSFLSTVVSSRLPTTNNQLRNSSIPRQQATIHDGRVTVQPVQRRQSSFVAGTSRTRANISGISRNNSGQQRVLKDKVLLVEAQVPGKVLNEEELEFLAYSRAAEGPAVLMANLSSYGSDVLFEITPILYDGSVIAKETNVISITDTKETLMLKEESRSKIVLKQGDLKVLEKKVNIKPIDYVKLNRLSKDFVNYSVAIIDSVNYVEMCNKCLELEAELIKQHNMVEKDEKTHIYYLKHTMEQAAIHREIVKQAYSLNPLDSASYFACKYVKLIQELLGYVRDTCPDIHKLRVSQSTKSSRSKSTDNTENDRILQISSSTKKKNKVEDHSRIIKCSKHMTGDRSQLTNFVHKFLETVKFGNNQITKIMGILGNQPYTLSIRDMMASSLICLLSIASKTKSWLWHRRLSHLNFGAINHLAQNGLVRGLPKLKYEKDHLCLACAMAKSKKQSHKPKSEDTNQEKNVSFTHGSLWAYACCYPNNDSEDLGKLQAKADIGIFIGNAPKKKAYHIFNQHTQKIIKTIHANFDELMAMASEQLGLGPEHQCITLTTTSSRLVLNPIPQQPCIPPPRDDWDRLFQPMFNEYFNPLTIVVSLVPVADAPRAVNLADSPVSTSIDQDALSINIPLSQEQEHSLIIS